MAEGSMMVKLVITGKRKKGRNFSPLTMRELPFFKGQNFPNFCIPDRGLITIGRGYIKTLQYYNVEGFWCRANYKQYKL